MPIGDTADTPSLEHKVNFLLSEHKTLRDEILLYAKARVQAVLYTIAANASIVAFISSTAHQNSQLKEYTSVIAWIPLVVSVIGYAYYYESVVNIARIVGYISSIEEKFARPDFGWEHYVQRLRKDYKNVFQRPFRARYLYNPVFWLQIGFSVFFGLAVSGITLIRP